MLNVDWLDGVCRRAVVAWGCAATLGVGSLGCSEQICSAMLKRTFVLTVEPASGTFEAGAYQVDVDDAEVEIFDRACTFAFDDSGTTNAPPTCEGSKAELIAGDVVLHLGASSTVDVAVSRDGTPVVEQTFEPVYVDECGDCPCEIARDTLVVP